jgi:hypothetical protein
LKRNRVIQFDDREANDGSPPPWVHRVYTELFFFT